MSGAVIVTSSYVLHSYGTKINIGLQPDPRPGPALALRGWLRQTNNSIYDNGLRRAMTVSKRLCCAVHA